MQQGRLRLIRGRRGRKPSRTSARMLETRHRSESVPDRSETALLLIDVINELEFDGADKLLSHALPMASALAGLKRRAKAHGIPVIYANDNFGRWRSDFPTLVEQCLKPNVRGRAVVAQLIPEEDLDLLLRYLGVTTLILTGMAGDICVLFSANDAYMRDLRIIVPPDCIASEDVERNIQALSLMQRVLKADTTTLSSDLDLRTKKRIK